MRRISNVVKPICNKIDSKHGSSKKYPSKVKEIIETNFNLSDMNFRNIYLFHRTIFHQIRGKSLILRRERKREGEIEVRSVDLRITTTVLLVSEDFSHTCPPPQLWNEPEFARNKGGEACKFFNTIGDTRNFLTKNLLSGWKTGTTSTKDKPLNFERD